MITNTPIFLEGDKLEITSYDSDSQTYYSYITEVGSENDLLIQAPINKGIIVPLSYDKRYEIIAYVKDGMYKFDGLLLDRLKTDNLYFLKIQIIGPIRRVQRRSYFRLDKVFDINFQSLGAEKWEKGTGLDISGGGIRFTSPIEYKPEDNIFFRININLNDKKETIIVSAIIIDAIKTDNIKEPYTCRAYFDQIDVSEQEKIIKYIFQEQRLMRRKERGM